MTQTSVAVVGPDHSVTVFSVPAGWDRDNPPCQTILHIPPAPTDVGNLATIGKAQQVEWVRKDGREWLAIGGNGGVLLFDPGSHPNEESCNMDQMSERYKVLEAEGVSFSA